MDNKELYQTADSLAKSGQKIADELFKFNPSFEGNNGKKSLATLAGIARKLEYEYKQLKIDLIKKHESESINGINPDS